MRQRLRHAAVALHRAAFLVVLLVIGLLGGCDDTPPPVTISAFDTRLQGGAVALQAVPAANGETYVFWVTTMPLDVLSPARQVVWSSRHTAAGWGEPVRMTPTSVEGAYWAQPLVFSATAAPDGSAAVVWADDTALWARRYQPDVGWQAPERIDGAGGRVSGVTLASDAGGNLLAVWHVGDDSSSVWSNRLDAGGDWAGATPLAAQAGYPTLAMSASGDAVVAYTEAGEIMTRRFTAASGWASPLEIPVVGELIGSGPSLAMAADGRALLAWAHHLNGVTGGVWSEGSGTGWTLPPRMTDPNPVRLVMPPLINAAGDALLCWDDSGSTRCRQRLDGGDWSAGFSGPTPGETRGMAAGLAGSGKAIMVMNNAGDLYVSRRDARGVWPVAQRFRARPDGVNALHMFSLQVVADADGDFAAAWLEWGDDGSSALQLARFR